MIKNFVSGTKGKITAIFIGVIVVSITIYDVFVIVKHGVDYSISTKIIAWSYEFPVFTFAMGFICGHLFWRLRDSKKTKKLKKVEDGTTT